MVVIEINGAPCAGPGVKNEIFVFGVTYFTIIKFLC